MHTIKFAIWGIGTLGKELIRMLGKQVSCIVEGDSIYHDTYYKDIPVISVEKYIASYSKYPIIITPANFEDEIAHILASKGVSESIKYSTSVPIIEAFWIKKPISKFLEDFDYNKRIIVYGGGILGYLLFNYLQENKFVCSISMQYGYQGNVSLKSGLTEWKREDIKDTQVILTIPLEEKDKAQIEGLNIKAEKLYKTILCRDLYYYPDLERFRNIHINRRCFVVATGPSLKIKDLDKLYEAKEICFSVNGIFGAFEQTQWRPNYYMVSDPVAVQEWKDSIIKERIEEKFIASRAWIFDDNEAEANMHKWHVFRIPSEGKMPHFSDEFARGTFAGKTVIYDGVLQLAIYMGISEIYLLGVDCNYKKGGKDNYFFKGQKADTLDHHENDMIQAYKAAKEYADSHGIKIYNATRGGMLEVFERVNFDSLF